MEAWVASAEGRPEEALAEFRSAAEAEDILGKNPVSPGALLPVREQRLGDLSSGAASAKRSAFTAYQAALKIYPNRFQGLYGAATAAERLGDSALARGYYGQLAKQTLKSEGSRPEVKQVRAYLAVGHERRFHSAFVADVPCQRRRRRRGEAAPP